MNMKKMLSLLLFLPFFAARAHAQDGSSVQAVQAVTDAVEALRKAMIDPDKAALDKLTATGLSYGHSGGQIQTQAEFIDALVSGKSDFVTIDLSNQVVAVTGDVAVVRHILSATTNDGGKPGTVKLSVLLVWQLQGGAWKLLARQAVHVQ
jgi:ketosteroid isomerase-like protein